MKKIMSIVLAAVLCMALLCPAQADGLAAGVYTASAKGMNEGVTVQVTVDETGIAAVEVISHNETAGISDPAIARLPQNIVDAQSVLIDGVSGATLTSNAILTAVADCIAQAGGDAQAMQPAQAKTYEKKLTAGTYQGVGSGHHSDIKVEVVMTEDAIESVTVVESGDNINIGNVAIERVPAAIVANQSIIVDTVAGATFTSRAILAAVEDCLVQAGGEDAVRAFDIPVPKAERSTEEKTEAADVVVVGGGLTGMMAALAAQDEGASVIVLEKLPYYGGISQTSAGALKFASAMEGKEEEFYQYLHYKPVGLMQDPESMDTGYPDDESCRVLATRGQEISEWLIGMGVPLVIMDGLTDETGTWTNSLAMFNDGVHVEPDNCAAGIDVMVKVFLERGGKLYLETPATELITDANGAVVGVKAEGIDGNYTFTCKAVALCCGGFGANPEMLAELAPAFAGETVGATGIGNTGDGIRMARAIGAAVYEDNFLMGGSGQTFVSYYDRIQPFADAETPKSSLYVNPMGQRVNSEDPVSYTSAIAYCNPDVEDYYWAIMNEEVANTKYYENSYYPSEETCRGVYIDLLEEAIAEGKPGVYKADTLEELAKMIKITPSTLKYTMNRYNKMCEQGVDEDLGKKQQYLIAMNEGPWYAAKSDMEFFGTVGGVVTDAAAAVLREDGTAIPGLFAAGEMSNHKVLNMSYSGGVSVAENVVFGKVAGESAAAAAGFAK